MSRVEPPLGSCKMLWIFGSANGLLFSDFTPDRSILVSVALVPASLWAANVTPLSLLRFA